MHVHLPVALCGFDVVRIRCGGVGIVNGVIFFVKKNTGLKYRYCSCLGAIVISLEYACAYVCGSQWV
jgi:hypothetical protein